jgi:hypothetical protein
LLKSNRRANADGDYAMKRDSPKPAADATEERLVDDWFDPIETDLRTKVRGFIETMIEAELETALSRPRYRRQPRPAEVNTAAPVAGMGIGCDR